MHRRPVPTGPAAWFQAFVGLTPGDQAASRDAAGAHTVADIVHTPPTFIVPRGTRALSVTGATCALNCAHCGGHYLGGMSPLAATPPDAPSIRNADSLLISGGSLVTGRVPLERAESWIAALPADKALNLHVGLADRTDLAWVERLRETTGPLRLRSASAAPARARHRGCKGPLRASVRSGRELLISFEMVGDDTTVREVFGLDRPATAWRDAWRTLDPAFTVVPHVTIGLHGGQVRGERTVIDWLAAAQPAPREVVFLVFRPTPNTRLAKAPPPDIADVLSVVRYARERLPATRLVFGCMRPSGQYRAWVDPLAWLAGIDTFVMPHATLKRLVADLHLTPHRGSECCSIVLARHRQEPHEAPPQPDRDGISCIDTSACHHGPLRVSYGTAIELGLKTARQDVAPTTAYLLWDRGCAGTCSYCPRAGGDAGNDRLSRVRWPEFATDDILTRLATPTASAKRICLQTGYSPDHRDQLLALASRIAGLQRPTCVTLHPRQVDLADALFARGVEKVGIGLDAVTAEEYARHKGGDFAAACAGIRALLQRHPGRVGVHLIFGLGADEQAFAETMAGFINAGATIALFAFTPTGRNRVTRNAQCTPADAVAPHRPDMGAWRRLQALRALLIAGRTSFARCRFARRRLVDLGIPTTDVGALPVELASGDAFRTSGCPDCNRPFYNESPGEELYSYPRPLTTDETRAALARLDLATVVADER